MDSSDWLQRDINSVWHGFTQMQAYPNNEPVIVESGEGNYLIDINGKRYLDAISSLWVNTLGHGVAELNEALTTQARKIAHSTMLGNSNSVTIEFAEALQKVVPVDRARFVFASDGAAAVEQALKIAFQYWTNRGVHTKSTFLAFGDAYHGDTIGSLSVGAGGFGTEIFDPLRFDVIRAPSFRDPDALTVAARLVREHADRLAAVIVEPLVQGAAGMQMAPADSFAQLQHACGETGVLLICDEVATGFGRTGTMFASEQCDLTPDLICIGKGITGGYLPLSATGVAQHVWEAFLGPDLSERTLYHGHSYSGNALACAVGLRHLQLMQEREVLANVRAQARHLDLHLEAARNHPGVREVRWIGLVAAVELDDGGDELIARKVCAEMTRNGVLCRSLGAAVTIVPPLVVTADEIAHIVAAMITSIDNVRNEP